jgi:hypothetical protein
MTDGDAVFAGMSFFFIAVAVVTIAGVVLSAAIGYWCMKVFESKGRSGGAGFLLGFALTFFFSVAGAAAAVAVAYLWDAPLAQPDPAAPRLPPPAPPLSAEALTVATFTSATGWYGRRVVYDRGLLQVEGVCVVLPAHVQDYARNGQVEWASDAMRDWIADWAARGS